MSNRKTLEVRFFKEDSAFEGELIFGIRQIMNERLETIETIIIDGK